LLSCLLIIKPLKYYADGGGGGGGGGGGVEGSPDGGGTGGFTGLGVLPTPPPCLSFLHPREKKSPNPPCVKIDP